MPLTTPANEARIDNLLSQMTLDEKIGQLNQINPHMPFSLDALRQGKIGSMLNAAGALTGQGFSTSSSAASVNEYQRIAVQESRLGIPLLFGRDVIHGYRTVFPIPLGLAAAFDPSLTEQASAVAAREASADGVKWTFAPMIDLARDPRWGRVAEGAGEDTYLGCLQTAAAVRGFQGTDFSAPDRIAACAKHYVGYGGAEGGRDYDSAEISMRTLREFYLPPYQAAVDAGVATLMSAFHDLAGIPMTAHRPLLTDVLRGEWGFQGFVVSDWESIGELVLHGIAADRAAAAALGLHAGVEMDMVSQVYIENLNDLCQRGEVPQDEINEAARRVLRIKLAAGLFENPYTDETRAARDILTADHRALARQIAAQCLVLLKNEADLLPLDGRFRHVAVVGPLAQAHGELLGCWTPDGRPEDMAPLPEAFRAAAPQGMHLSFTALPDQAIWHAMDADLVIAVVGEHPLRSGENNNVANLELPPGQRQLVQALASLGKPLVLVVLAGRPLVIPEEAALCQAVLYAFHPGTEGGAALAEVLFGAAEPGGRLPISLPRATGQVPIYYNHKSSGRPVGGGQFTRRYLDVPHGPLYPFGYGLGYTRFDYKDLVLSSDLMRDTLEVRANLTNTGSRPGSETVQLYVRDLVGQVTRPVKELKGFQKVFLQPGETRQVTFTLHQEDLAFIGLDERKVIEPGEFHVWVGPHSAAGLRGSFRI